MKTIAIMNLKGGAGKTTTAINMAAILATEYGQRVLLIDADGQRNATKSLLPMRDGRPELCLSDYLRCEVPGMWRQYIAPSTIRNLDLIPGDTGLWDLELGQSASKGALAALCDALIEADAYDYCIVDCPPGFTVGCINAILASNVVIIPSPLDGYSDDGAMELIAQINSLRRVSPNVRVGGVLVTMWYKSEQGRLHEALLRERHHINVYSTVIRRSPKVSESTYDNGQVLTYSPRSAAGADYRKFVREFLAREEALSHGRI